MKPNSADYLPHVAGDLNWVINSSFLTAAIPKPDFRDHPDTQRLITATYEDPSPILPDITAMKRHNLGTYFETLVFYWLRNLAGVEILTRNHQINEGTRTVGELDLVFSYQNQIYHWELSIKFYACTGDPVLENNWVGPLKKDTLAKKLDRLFSHQLPLIEHYSPGSDTDERPAIQSYPFVKGMLFHQTDQNLARAILPPRININCLQNRWCQSDEIDLDLLKNTTHISIVPKRKWLSDADSLEWLPLLSPAQSPAQLQEIAASSSRPQLIAFATAKISEKTPVELSRHFIMTPEWLQSPTLIP